MESKAKLKELKIGDTIYLVNERRFIEGNVINVSHKRAVVKLPKGLVRIDSKLREGITTTFNNVVYEVTTNKNHPVVQVLKTKQVQGKVKDSIQILSHVSNKLSFETASNLLTEIQSLTSKYYV